MAVPAAKVFFEEVRGTFAEVAERLGLEGPSEEHDYAPIATVTYRRVPVEYEVVLGIWEGYVEIKAGLDTEGGSISAGVENLAIAAGIVEKRGSVSSRARSLKQMKKSLVGQLAYVELLHPLLSDDAASALALIREARALP